MLTFNMFFKKLSCLNSAKTKFQKSDLSLLYTSLNSQIADTKLCVFIQGSKRDTNISFRTRVPRRNRRSES